MEFKKIFTMKLNIFFKRTIYYSYSFNKET